MVKSRLPNGKFAVANRDFMDNGYLLSKLMT